MIFLINSDFGFLRMFLENRKFHSLKRKVGEIQVQYFENQI